MIGSGQFILKRNDSQDEFMRSAISVSIPPFPIIPTFISGDRTGTQTCATTTIPVTVRTEERL